MPASSEINRDVLQTVLEIKLQYCECGAIASAGSFPGTYPENGIPSVPALVSTKRSHTAKPLPSTGSKSCYLYKKPPTLNWFQLSFLTCKQVLVLSYTQSTAIPGVSHILSPHHLAPCWLEEWYLAWNRRVGSPGCWHTTSICWNVGKSELP